jgi:hypothetical protein
VSQRLLLKRILRWAPIAALGIAGGMPLSHILFGSTGVSKFYGTELWNVAAVFPARPDRGDTLYSSDRTFHLTLANGQTVTINKADITRLTLQLSHRFSGIFFLRVFNFSPRMPKVLLRDELRKLFCRKPEKSGIDLADRVISIEMVIENPTDPLSSESVSETCR